jgi:plasmid stabilization system protein ParE
VIEAIFESTEILKTSYEIYKLDELKNNNDGSFRVLFVFSYMISYQISEKTIQILRVRHTSQKPKKL